MKHFPWHTFLMALLPILSMYGALPGLAVPAEVARAALIACGVAATLLLAALLVYRDVRKAGLLITVVLAVFVAFGATYASLELFTVGGVRPFRRVVVLPATYLLIAGIAWAIARTRRPLLQLTSILNVVAVGCVALPLYSLVRVQGGAALRATPVLPLPAATGTAVKPDIYYVVLDRYGDEPTMRQHGFDNGAFYRFLEGRGFYVARESRSNYVKTALSLASSLNMDYLEPLRQAEGGGSDNWRPVYDWIRDARVPRFLKSQGYRYVHAGSWFWPTEASPTADRNVNFYTTVPYAEMELLDNVLLEPLRPLASLAMLDLRLQQWHRVRRQIADVVSHAGDPGPTFTFLHILVPHPPYVFDRDGGYVSESEEDARDLSTNYINQVVAANAMAAQLIDGIVQRARTPPVIILQGDEGPYPEGTTGLSYNWHTANVTDLREKSGILNAYLLPGGGAAGLYPSISPVNSFRVVLNTYFGTALPVLPDRVFAHESEWSPYSFVELTDTLRGATRVSLDPERSSPTPAGTVTAPAPLPVFVR